MKARLDLIAHGSTAATRAARFPDDESLEASAVGALEGLRGRLSPYGHVMIAPSRAAHETAEALGLDAAIETALRDCDYGRWRGLSAKAVAEREPDGFATWLGDPGAAPHGGESFSKLIERVRAWLAQSLTHDGATLAVTHASVVRAAMASALGAPPSSVFRIDVAPLSLARLSGREGRWNLVAFGPLRALS